LPPKKSPSQIGASPSEAPQHCDTCRQEIAVCDSVHYGSTEAGYRLLCSRCFNEEVARQGDLDFQHVQFDPVEMPDSAGATHQFHFRVHLLGDQVALNAFELKDGAPRGYEFQVLGDAEADLFSLMAQMIERMRRALAMRHLQKERGQFHIADMTARGHITWDSDEDGRVPLLVIDGHEITWDDFGRMLMTFEGFQFKLEIHDKSEEV
jgi:hypothetical protein